MKDNQAKYPQLRLKGFTDHWEKRTLGQTTTKAKSYSLSRDVERDHETGYRYIHYGDIHTGVADIVTEHTKLPNIEPANYDELRVNDLVVADASEDYQGIAEPAVVVGLPTHLVAGLHTITLRPSSASSLYLYYLLHTDSFKHFGYQMGTGLKVFGISWSNLSKFTFMIPSRPEQEMIVKLIESVDNLIAVNQRKLAKLKELKQGYLQKLFSKNGSKFPQLRFAGFADAWEERKLGNLFSVTDTKHATAPTTDKETQFRMIRTSYVRDGRLLVDQTESVTEQTYKQWSERIRLQPGDIVFSREAPIGEVAIIPDNSYHFFLGQRMVALRSTTEVSTDAQFTLATLLAPRFRREVRIRDAASNTVANFGIPDIKKTSIYVPTPTEQNKLGTLIMMISDTIALHQRKLEKLQELKKGYLQKMFC